MRQKDFSKKCFYDAVVSLCEDCNYNDISVKQICKKAGFNRSTFYRCYKTKDDIFTDRIIEVIGEFNQYLMANFGYDKENFVMLFNFLRKQGYIYSIMHKANLDELIKKICYDNFISDFRVDEYEKVFINNGILAVVFSWYENGMKESDDYMATLLSRYVSVNSLLSTREN